MGLRLARALLVAVALLGCAALVPAHALEVGVRAGRGMDGAEFRSEAVFIRPAWRPRLGDPGGWHWRLGAEAHAARVRRRNDTLWMAGVGITGWLQRAGFPLRLGLGTGPTYLSASRIADRDLGGPWAFTSHLTLRFMLGPHASVGYRLQHTSNADFYRPNPGFDIQAVELRVGF